MKNSSGVGRIVLGSERFNGIKVFSATMAVNRAQLGDQVTEWLERHRDCLICEIVVTQSSDAKFHCLAITVFYRR